MAFLSVTAINVALRRLPRRFPDLCQLITLPELSREGRVIRAVRIRSGDSTGRCGVLLTGGVHARELMNPDGLIAWAFDLCQAFTDGTGLTFGGAAFEAGTVQTLLESLDVFIVPMVNPDGRAFVLAPGGNAMWRKNRADFGEAVCRGVDLNRNCDLLWESGIGSSTDSCSDIFKGPSAFSEPETRNIKALLDDHSGICCYMDVHSFSELVIFPWGDDEIQTSDPDMNFRNPDFDGLRGTAGDGDYQEFMPQDDLDWHQSIATGIKNSIQAVRGHEYTVGPSFTTLYPTSATIKDFCYSRHFVDTGLRKIRAFLLETGNEFQPDAAEVDQVLLEIGAAATQLCFGCFCAAEAANTRFDLRLPLDPLRDFRNVTMRRTPLGKRLAALFEQHGPGLMALAVTNKEFGAAATALLRAGAELAVGDLVKARLSPEILETAETAMRIASRGASEDLAKAIQIGQAALALFAKEAVGDALKRDVG